MITDIEAFKQADLAEKLRLIKRSLHAMMNGPVSESMRTKGLNYKINFGVELPRLLDFSKEMPKNRKLAMELWKEHIRECRLLAGMLMPPEDFTPDYADLWVEQTQYTEEADCMVIYLFQHLPFASEKAFEWLADERSMFRYTAYQLLSRLFMQNKKPCKRDVQEYLDHTATDLRAEEKIIKMAAYKTLLKYMDLGIIEERFGERILKDTGL